MSGPQSIKCLEFLRSYIAEHGYSPITKEVADALDVWPSQANRVLHDLASDGLIRIQRGIRRGITVLDQVCPHCGSPISNSAPSPSPSKAGAGDLSGGGRASYAAGEVQISQSSEG